MLYSNISRFKHRLDIHRIDLTVEFVPAIGIPELKTLGKSKNGNVLTYIHLGTEILRNEDTTLTVYFTVTCVSHKVTLQQRCGLKVGIKKVPAEVLPFGIGESVKAFAVTTVSNMYGST